MNNYEERSSTNVTGLHTSIYISFNLTDILKNQSDTQEARFEIERLNDKELRYLLPSIVYTALLMVIGTPGNGVVLYVYFFKWRKSTSRMFILFLTGLDFLNCITTLPMEIFIMRYSLMLDLPWLCKLSRFGTYTMNSASAAILVAIAIDRFKRICRPHGEQFSSRKSKYICIGCIIFVLMLTWPVPVLFGTRYITLGAVIGTSCLLENQFDTSTYPYIYFIIMMGSTVIIFTTLSILYYFVGLQICKHRMLRQRRRQRQAKVLVEKSSTKSNSANLLKGTEIDDLKSAPSTKDHLAKQQNHVATQVETNDVNEHALNELAPCAVDEELTSTYVQVCEDNVRSETVVKEIIEQNDLDEKKVDHGNIQNIPLEQIKVSESRESTDKKNGLSERNALLRSSPIRKNHTSCMSINNRIGKSTLMLFLITLAYIISFLPYYILVIIRQSDRGFVSQLSDGGYMAYHFFLRSYQLSSAINPIIYSFCNAQFRTFVRDLFLRKSRQMH